jgi:predicted phage terminase large subunit-like protein
VKKSITYLRAQQGKQQMFISTPADIAIYGGAAGGGKTHGILLDAARFIGVKGYHGVIFRRTVPELKKGGSIWDESQDMYRMLGGTPKKDELKWVFPQGSDIKFAGMQYEDTRFEWKGSQLDYVAFDELTEFTERQFWYLFTRLRSTSGKIKPYMRGATNPEPNWVLNLIEWWIGKDGYPIPERCGKLRWFLRPKDELIWFDTEKEANTYKQTNGLPEQITPKSLTFISATVDDNPINLKKNPNYVGNLYAEGEIETERLLHGNWRIKPSGKLFKIEDFKNYSVKPQFSKKVIYIDTAQETKTANDYTVMQLWGKYENKIYLTKQFRGKVEYNEQLNIIVSMIADEKPNYICIERKANGIALIQSIKRELAQLGIACPIRGIERYKDKYTRGSECQGYVQSGYVYLNPHADYYPDFVSEVVQFSPENKNKSSIHDDQVDCMMDAIADLLIKQSGDGKVSPNNRKDRVNNGYLHRQTPARFTGYK